MVKPLLLIAPFAALVSCGGTEFVEKDNNEGFPSQATRYVDNSDQPYSSDEDRINCTSLAFLNAHKNGDRKTVGDEIVRSVEMISHEFFGIERGDDCTVTLSILSTEDGKPKAAHGAVDVFLDKAGKRYKLLTADKNFYLNMSSPDRLAPFILQAVFQDTNLISEIPSPTEWTPEIIDKALCRWDSENQQTLANQLVETLQQKQPLVYTDRTYGTNIGSCNGLCFALKNEDQFYVKFDPAPAQKYNRLGYKDFAQISKRHEMFENGFYQYDDKAGKLTIVPEIRKFGSIQESKMLFALNSRATTAPIYILNLWSFEYSPHGTSTAIQLRGSRVSRRVAGRKHPVRFSCSQHEEMRSNAIGFKIMKLLGEL